MADRKDIMFACVHNAGRSQMAAAFFNKHKHRDDIKGISAGTNPATSVHEVVRDIMLEKGIDLSNIQPVLLTPELAGTVSTIITMGCGETCPYVPGVKIVDWQITDPKNKSFDEAKEIRDEIEERIIKFINDNDL
ncbi:hypothetical protein BGZ65_006333 [Modicella reniformis]|uniref:Phosphotyrosine protein phosphatase I domain-containing protein n=1 Tax=Modicella reniformis TaxID=1440133 RepID=A0A9P6LX76_9FUNG|nr:hypothetical protein BGZ65_006333 [Modicella reniformis]